MQDDPKKNRVQELLADAALSSGSDKASLVAQAEALMRRFDLSYDDLRSPESNAIQGRNDARENLSRQTNGGSCKAFFENEEELVEPEFSKIKKVAISLFTFLAIGLVSSAHGSKVPWIAVLFDPDVRSFISKDPGGTFGSILGFGISPFVIPTIVYIVMYLTRKVVGKPKPWNWSAIFLFGVGLAPFVVFASYR